MTDALCSLGMVGLGTMGRNLLLNMADHGFTVAGFDLDQAKVASLQAAGDPAKVFGATNIEAFVKLLKRPCSIMLLVPAGKAVDAVIENLIPFLKPGDLIIDAGNSHFTDTNIRTQYLQTKGLQFLGVGVSGGEEGARRGPSIMPGGTQEAYAQVAKILEAVSAKVNSEPCVTYLGKGSVGHYVKMVHNGIEYALMQQIAEAYDLLKRGLKLPNAKIAEIFSQWNQSEVGGYLIEITANILARLDPSTHKSLLDEIVGVAKQNGTGMWTSQSAMELQMPVPSIDMAVSMRDLSVLVAEREKASKLYPRAIETTGQNTQEVIDQLKGALFTGMVVAYAQGFALLNLASQHYGYDLHLEAVAKIWRGGCIIRAKLLDPIAAAFKTDATLANLLLDSGLAKSVMQHQEPLRKVLALALNLGLPMPTLMLTLSYFDAYRSTFAPANLIQAQRDYFGAHTYQRLDLQGTFHTEWEKESE